MTDPRDYTLGEAEAYARGRAEALAEVEWLRRQIELCSGSCCLPEDWPARVVAYEAMSASPPEHARAGAPEAASGPRSHRDGGV